MTWLCIALGAGFEPVPLPDLGESETCDVKDCAALLEFNPFEVCVPEIGECCPPTCEKGKVWVCNDEGFMGCAFPGEVNECGGIHVLEDAVGDFCGDCGLLACDGDGDVICEDPGLNVCGGCKALVDEPGDVCGTCGDGTLECGAGALQCVGAEENGCGGCAPLGALPGEVCGECGEQTCAADDESLVCDDPGLNVCGGCEALDAGPGDACGSCGVSACDDGGLVCLDPGANACGGCGLIADEPGALCGQCGVVTCVSSEEALCVESINACGGCRPLADDVGAPCANCGTFECDGQDGVVCVEEPGACPAPEADFTRDILATELRIDLGKQKAHAEIAVAAAPGNGVTFEAQGLDVLRVTDIDQSPLQFEVIGGLLNIGVPIGNAPPTLVIDYTFEASDALSGLHADGFTFTWPYFCGNLYPCRSDPREGASFELTILGQEPGNILVYPAVSGADAPAYMLAWAEGPYLYQDLGQTAFGTRVGAYYYFDFQAQMDIGTVSLVDAFEWYEQNLGPYAYGASVASVQVDWPGGAFGGMEHHPYWHVGQDSFADATVHIHEAAHGWFGNGVRIECWEDFVLSEGVTSYLTAVAVEEVVGIQASAALWDSYDQRLTDALMNPNNLQVAWPQSCGQVDMLRDGLFSSVPYTKGAFFLQAVEERVGRAQVIDALATFYDERQGAAAGVQDLVDTLVDETDLTEFDLAVLVDLWLTSPGDPR